MTNLFHNKHVMQRVQAVNVFPKTAWPTRTLSPGALGFRESWVCHQLATLISDTSEESSAQRILRGHAGFNELQGSLQFIQRNFALRVYLEGRAMNVLEQGFNFRSLSIRDLLEARDLYHYQLMNKVNVVGTAIGLYLIRDQDGHDAPRTLTNSRVQPESWPCVLVYVHRWLASDEFSAGRGVAATDMLPKRLYMPDGRAVPVCVVQVDVAAPSTDQHAQMVMPNHLLGAGLQVTVRVQEVDRSAAIGCLVSDGHLAYALTARHACGPEGTGVFARLRGRNVPVGRSSNRQLTRLPLSEVYSDLPGRKCYLALDVGLVVIDDLSQWTSNVFGLPPAGPLADLYEQNLTLELIDQQVVAHGPVSGLLRGSIKGLFYRYRSVGGFDYVSDMLISPVPGSRSPVHGDSGSVWHLDVTQHKASPLETPVQELDLRPVAVLWGGQTLEVNGNPVNFTLATALSNVCKLLDVELVRPHSTDVSGYWGRMGHYSIAEYALDMVSDPQLRELLQANLSNITFDLNTLSETASKNLLTGLDMVPLADVADEVWKHFVSRPGGRDVKSAGQGRSTGPEHPNHYADIDYPYVGERSLRELCLSDADQYFTPEAFAEYYDWLEKTQPKLGGSKADPFKQGLLPFRTWQIFNRMLEFGADSAKTASFVAAAGIVAHYIGDACQPLHGSVYADGDPTRTKTITHPQSGKPDDVVAFASGIHSTYETAMIDRHKGELFEAIGTLASAFAGNHGLPMFSTGKQAGLATVSLMNEVANSIPPLDLCEAFEKLGGKPIVSVQDGLFEEFGEKTAQAMAQGARALACFWDSAWKASGAAEAGHALGRRSPAELKALYEDTTFLESLTLATVGSQL